MKLYKCDKCKKIIKKGDDLITLEPKEYDNIDLCSNCFQELHVWLTL